MFVFARVRVCVSLCVPAYWSQTVLPHAKGQVTYLESIDNCYSICGSQFLQVLKEKKRNGFTSYT